MFAFPWGKVDFLQLVAKKTDEGIKGFPEGKAPLCKEDSPIRENVVEDDKRVTRLAAKQTEGLQPCPLRKNALNRKKFIVFR